MIFRFLISLRMWRMVSVEFLQEYMALLLGGLGKISGRSYGLLGVCGNIYGS